MTKALVLHAHKVSTGLVDGSALNQNAGAPERIEKRNHPRFHRCSHDKLRLILLINLTVVQARSRCAHYIPARSEQIVDFETAGPSAPNGGRCRFGEKSVVAIPVILKP